MCLGFGEFSAQADEDRAFQEHYLRGMQLYKLNLLRQAIKEFIAAYAINPLPRLLYNLGQLQRKVGDYKDAIDSYELYLRTETDLSAERRAEVEDFLNNLRAAIKPAPPAEPSPVAPSNAEPAPAASTPPPAATSILAKAGNIEDSAAPTLLLILPPQRKDKAGRFLFNMGIGYAFPFFDSTLDGGLGGLVLRPEFGIAVLHNRNGYLIFAPQVQIIENRYQLLAMVGFQYDFPILARGLFLYLRGSIGYFAVVATGTPAMTASGGTSSTFIDHLGQIVPELGVKYVVNGKVTFGFEPISLPITFNRHSLHGSYRQIFYGGTNF